METNKIKHIVISGGGPYGLSAYGALKETNQQGFWDISNIKSDYNLDKYIILFPFCSPHLTIKKWPYYNELIARINIEFNYEYKNQ